MSEELNAELSAAIAHLEVYGYCLLPERIPREEALSLGSRCLELHADPANADFIHGDEYYQTLFGMINLDERVWQCAFHEDTLGIARHFLGPRCRVVEACSKPTWPGAPPQHLHVDSAGNFDKVPDIPWMINTIWMLSDFSAENGGTGVVPMSHRSRLQSPPAEVGPESPLIQPVEGCAGSVMLWHGGAWHQARANSSQEIRIGLNIAYYPRWFNNWVENGHQPIWPETYARMPEKYRDLVPGRQGRGREEAYER